MTYELSFTTRARKDAKKIARSSLKPHAARLLEIIKVNPYSHNPAYEKLVGDLSGCYLR